MSIKIFSKAFRFDVYNINNMQLMLTRQCYLNEIKKILDDYGLEFIEMDKVGSDSWKITVNPDSRWNVQ